MPHRERSELAGRSRIMRFHVADVPSHSAGDGVEKPLHLGRLSFGDKFDAPIVEVPRITRNAKAACQVLSRGAKPHALHVSGIEHSPADHGTIYYGIASR